MPTQYLRRYAEPEARLVAGRPLEHRFRHVLVIPAYRESAALAGRLQRLAAGVEKLLVVVVLNQPDTEPDAHCNDALRNALRNLAPAAESAHPVLAPAHSSLHPLSAGSALLLLERPLALPSREGVGLARKLGCDIATALRVTGCIESRWLHNSDADAHLPENYFHLAEQQPEAAVAITHPFTHQPHSGEQACNAKALTLPMSLYELRLHYYVLGLRSANSPYAFHTLGSCLSIDVEAYQQVRGYPRRAAAEDFYLLNKVAKLGPVSSPGLPVIRIDARLSDRVPFGTGPAVRELANSAAPLDAALFYDPRCFRALAVVIAQAPHLYADSQPHQSLAAALRVHAGALPVLETMGLARCLQHCAAHSRNSAAFTRHFHQWFDGFRTLKFIHGLRDSRWADLDLAHSLAHPQSVWPPGSFDAGDVTTLLHACTTELGWG